jgi:hypothetical protein
MTLTLTFTRLWRAAVLAVALLLASPSSPAAHEIPADVTVLSFVKPEGGTMRLLVRVPLTSMRDVVFPTRGAGYLDLAATRPLLPDLVTVWIAGFVSLVEWDTPLGEERVVATRISLPSDRSFDGYEAALAHVTGSPLPDATDIVAEQAMLDALLDVPITSERSRFSIEPEWAHLGLSTTTVLRFLPPDGGERILRYDGNPGLVRLDPRWHQAALGFLKLGVVHILQGLDHLLFLLCLVIPFRRLRSLVPIVTAFTVAHSITLGAAAMGLAPRGLWFQPLVETLIALSIVWMAVENILGARLERRWLMAFAFGLVHGFGFSFFLQETLQFAGSHLLTALLIFNLGVEIGQLMVVVVTVAALEWLLRKVPERAGVIVLSALVTHTAWHWMTERGSALLQYDFRLPVLNLALLAAAMRWMILFLVAGGALWVLYGLFERWAARAREAGPTAELVG